MAEDTSGSASSASPVADQAKPFLPKRSHKKSRLGCASCKLRKVKCDETRPACRSCRLRKTKCEYGLEPMRIDSRPKTPAISTSNSLPRLCPAGVTISIPNEPQLLLPSSDRVDMKLLWFYTSTTYKSLSYADETQRYMNEMLQTVLVQHAFESPFLMDSILELASLHMQSLGQAPEPTRAMVYRARSIEGYRKAIQAACPKTFGALLANAVLRPILSTQLFREPNFKELYILDWMLLWHGIPSIIEITGISSIATSGMQPLFARPKFELEGSVVSIPKQLLLMVSFIDSNDEDASEIRTYQESLRALASLFEHLERGMDSVMVLRIVTWCTAAPHRLLELSRAKRPRALVILAHYAAFLKLLQDIWWLVGVGDSTIREICHFLGPEWNKYMNIPLSAMLIENTIELSRVLLASGDK